MINGLKVKNQFGKNFDGGELSYVTKAKATKDTYFNLGRFWNLIKECFDYSDSDIFEMFNKSAIDYAVENGKMIRFTVNPESYINSFTFLELMLL